MLLDLSLFLKSRRKDVIPFLCGFIAILLVTFPVLSSHVNVTLDGVFHLSRIQSLFDALKGGIFPVKVHPTLLYTYGYGVGFFYPNLFLYFPALLMRLGLSLEVSYHIYALCSVTCAYLIACICVSHLTGDTLSGVAAGILLISSPFYLSEVYDGSIGTYTAIGIFTAVICGLTELAEGRKSGRIPFCLGLIGVLQSHSISFFILLITLFLLCVLYAKNFVKKPTLFGTVFVCGLVSALLSANYLFPAFEQIAHQKFRGQTELQSIPLYEKTLSLSQLFERIGALPVIAFFLCVTVTVFLYRKKHSVGLHVRLILLIPLLSALICCPPFWKITYGLLAFFQYPVRMLNMVTALIALLAGVTVSSLKEQFQMIPYGRRTAAIAVLALMAALTGRTVPLSKFYSERVIPLAFTAEEFDEAISNTGREWLPVELHSVSPESSATAVADDGSGADGIKHDNGISYETWLEMEKAYYYIPYAYYYGYRAYLLGEDGSPERELSCCKGENGLLKVTLPENGNGIGHIVVSYQKTPIQHMGYCISLLTVACCIAVALRKGFRRRRMA